MGSSNISALLKQLRKTSSYSVNDVVEQLKNYGIEISSKTLYGYESGLSMPNADAFVALCKIYNCDNPMDIFGGHSVDVKETSLIEKYRLLDSYGQDTVDFLINREVNRVQLLQEKDQRIAELESSNMHSFSSPTLMAAHNDHASKPGELEKMKRDMELLKRPNKR